MQTIAPHKLIKRTHDGKTYHVFADPSGCKCIYVGNEAAYARYKTLVQSQQERDVHRGGAERGERARRSPVTRRPDH